MVKNAKDCTVGFNEVVRIIEGGTKGRKGVSLERSDDVDYQFVAALIDEDKISQDKARRAVDSV
jgi:hypothetical protein